MAIPIKLVFAAISAAAGVVGAVAKIKAAKQQAKIQLAQIEYEMEAERLARERNIQAVMEQHQFAAAAHIAYGGAAGAGFGGSFFAKSAANLSRRNRDIQTLKVNSSIRATRFGSQKVGVNLGLRSAKTEGYVSIGKNLAKLGYAGYEQWGTTSTAASLGTPEVGSGGAGPSVGGYTGSTTYR